MNAATESRKNLINLTLFSLIAALSCSVFGYLTLPIASGLYASVLLFEKHRKRFASYILPILSFVLNFLINGLFSLEGCAYAIIGTVIYFFYTKNRSKSEAVFYTSLLCFSLIIISAVFLSFDGLGVVRLSAVKDFYYHLYTDFKAEFISAVSSLTAESVPGEKYFIYNYFEASELFSEIIILLIPCLMIFAFVLVGLSLKIFDIRNAKLNLTLKQNKSWSFVPSTPTAIFYIVLSLISSVASGNDVFTLSAEILYFFFFAVFAYLGIKFIYKAFSNKLGKARSLMVIILSLFVFSGLIIQILSYIGAYASIKNNKTQTSEQG